MAPIDMLLVGGVPSYSLPATLTRADDDTEQEGHGPTIVLRCGSAVVDEVLRYAAHLLLDPPYLADDDDGACSRETVPADKVTSRLGLDSDRTWTTKRDALRLEAVGSSRDAQDRRTTLFQPDAGVWRFVDGQGRRLSLEVTINNAKPVSGECEPQLYREAVLTYHGRHPGSDDGTLKECDSDGQTGSPCADIVLPRAKEETAHQALEAFLSDAHQHAEPKIVDRIIIRRWTGTHWTRHSRPNKRPLDTLFLPADALCDVVDDMTTFLASEADYARFGRPYKRVYLLSGAPGLGKSSLALALAGHFDMDLYVYAIDDESTDQGLGAAVSAVDAPCALLIEDVDCAGGPKSHLTLSGLTNVLDGAQTRHGVAVFLTTNYPDRLEGALVRSGRVDKWLRFDAATADQIVAMVMHHFAAQFDVPTANIGATRGRRSSSGEPARLQRVADPFMAKESAIGVAGMHSSTTSDDGDRDGDDKERIDAHRDVDRPAAHYSAVAAAARARKDKLRRIANRLADRRVSAAALSEFLFERRRSDDIVSDLATHAKTIGRRSTPPSLGTELGGVDGARNNADVSSMYC
jgi:hypothetical protein